jgi:hypothetical protein
VLYPNGIAAARVLWQLPMAKLGQVMKLSNEPAMTIAQAHTSGNQK